MESVPGGVLEIEVSAGAVVDEDHERDAEAAERVERAEPLLLSRIGALLLCMLLFSDLVRSHNNNFYRDWLKCFS